MTDLQKFRSILSKYGMTSRSDEIRLELCAMIEACYCNGIIERDEYQSAMEYIR